METLGEAVIAYWLVYFATIFISIAIIAANGFEPDWIEAIATAAGTLIAGLAALKGFQIWRQEARGTRRAQVAEELILSVSTAIEAIKASRQPALKLPGNVASTTSATSALRRRLDYLNSKESEFAAMATSAFKAEIILGEEIKSLTNAICIIRDDVVMSLRLLIQVSAQRSGDPDEENIIDQAHDTVIASQGDKIQPKLDDTFRAILKKCEQYISLKS